MTQRLRLRICLMDPSKSHILYENSLAEEFGVSRTPVRQVLQRLAFEHQVETRTGVGTVVPQLTQDGLAQDIRLFSGLLTLAAQTTDNTMTSSAQSHLSLLEGRTNATVSYDKTDTNDLFETYSWLIEFTRLLITEPIISDMSAALFWRVLRRMLQKDQTSIDAQRRVLNQLCKALMALQDPRAALRLISVAADNLSNLSYDTP